MPIRVSTRPGSQQQLGRYLKSARTRQAAELSSASVMLRFQAAICILRDVTPYPEYQLAAMYRRWF